MNKYDTNIAVVIYARRKGQTLMMLRDKKENDPNKGKYIGLGGKLEKGELPDACVSREFKEESGYDSNEFKLLGMYYKHFYNEQGEPVSWLVYVYVINEFEGEFKPCEREGTYLWVDDKKLLNLNLNDNDRDYIKELDNVDSFKWGSYFFDKQGIMINRHVSDMKNHDMSPDESRKIGDVTRLMVNRQWEKYHKPGSGNRRNVI